MSCEITAGCKVVSATGAVLAEVPLGAGDAFTVATVSLPDVRPRPLAAQPRSTVSWLSYLSSDVILSWLAIPVYRRGVRRAWGAQMAPLGRGARLALALRVIGRAARRQPSARRPRRWHRARG
ncbi:hypothetical protein EKD04_005360 [Chloroflexales bacterium ZM16-3]|nr:hypothetical protein [Chloroflexales bacterium ZM16-3]